ncbi:MAG: methylated-DNA--[protein]-cysteine S-methyltransferase [Bacillota bacterium]
MIKHSFLTKIGVITLYSNNNKIITINLNSDTVEKDLPDQAILEAKAQILEYFSGTRKTFDFPYELSGTKFFITVLKTMKKIPYKKTWSYTDLAIESGNEKAIRAVGTVCKNNPLPLIFPCHRVIKKTGEIGNFNGGIKLKKFLLALEKRS